MDYININTIADRIKRHPLLEDMPFETILDYTIEFIKLVGMPAAFLEKTTVISIKDYRGVLPCDLVEVIQVRDNKGSCFRYSTDSFHMSTNKKYNIPKGSLGLTYKIQGNVIFTSIIEGEIEIAYRAFPMNEEGLPLIPDNGSYARALQEFIKLQYFTILFDQGRITPQVLHNTQQQYSWAVGQAQADLIMPTIDQMESLSNMWTRLIPNTREHSRGFVDLGSKEIFKKH